MLTTTERGYGAAHQRARKRALAALVDGTPCPFCGQGMYRVQKLHFDHETPLALGGDGSDGRLSHARCNMSAGVQVREQLRGAGLRRREPSRQPGWYTPYGLRVSRQWGSHDVRWVGPGKPPPGTALPGSAYDATESRSNP